MKLYIALANFDYEGSDVIGVYDTHEKAKDACENHKYKDGTIRGDSRSVEEYELNVPIIVNI